MGAMKTIEQIRNEAYHKEQAKASRKAIKAKLGFIPKTIDVNGKEWFDKTYGNSYFSAVVTMDYLLPSQRTILLPFQYGYGDSYTQAAAEALGLKAPLSYSAREAGIMLRASIERGCLQRDVKAWGRE